MKNKQFCGRLSNGDEIFLVRIANAEEDLAVEIMTFGATIKSIYAKDRYGNMTDVVLGQDTFEDYQIKPFCSGSVIGRFANRIGNAEFELNGKVCRLEANDKGNCTHSGSGNYGMRNFQIDEIDHQHVTLSLLDQGEGGMPGEVQVSIDYRITEDNVLRITYRALSTEDTPINFTNHSYFNLSGDKSGIPVNHEIRIHADFFTKSDESCLPTGEILKVEGTPLDFRRGVNFGKQLDKLLKSEYSFGGYDHNYVLKKRGFGLAATAYDPASGRFLEVYTDQPGMQFYSANHLNGEIPCKGGRKYERHCAYCFETQGFPDAIHQSHFPECIIKAGKPWKSTTEFRFSVRR